MKKVIRLTEADLTRIVKRVLNESTPTAAPATGTRGYDIKDYAKYPGGSWNVKDILSLHQKGLVKVVGPLLVDLDKKLVPKGWCDTLGTPTNPGGGSTYPSMIVAIPKDELSSQGKRYTPFAYYCMGDLLMPKAMSAPWQFTKISELTKGNENYKDLLGKLTPKV